MDDLLQQGITAYKAGKRYEARKLFITFVKQSPENERAWGWMYNVSDNHKEREYCLKQILRINPQNEKAKQLLDNLTGNDIPFESPKSVPPPIQPQKDIGAPISLIEKSTVSKKISNPSQVNSLELAANKKSNKPVVAKKANKQSVILLVVLGLLGVFCVCGLAMLGFLNPINSSNSNQQNNPLPTQRARPNYKQMLEANGFAYFGSDGEGNPSYASPCNAIATVRSDSVGFAAANSDTNCAAKDIGTIVSIMYPSEVFDFVITAMNSLNGFDQAVTGKAVGYDISVAITEYNYTLVVIIREPR